VEIRNQCNKDLRNAIVTLQFLAAGKTIEGVNNQATKKKLKNNRMRLIEEELDGDEAFLTSS
jgi:hypothetical protein